MLPKSAKSLFLLPTKFVEIQTRGLCENMTVKAKNKNKNKQIKLCFIFWCLNLVFPFAFACWELQRI